jgi:two-component system CheB/CheR fusion protein
MTVDPQAIRSEHHTRVGSLIQRDVALIIERWNLRAVAEQPGAARLHHEALQDDLSTFLRELGRTLAESDDDDNPRHRVPAYQHGKQRWEAGWSLIEVIRDYQILRLVILDYLQEVLDRPLRARESMAIGLALDEAIAASAAIYVRRREEEIRQAEEARHRRQAEALQEMNRRKDEFLAILGHELRNPLAPVRNSLFVLRERGQDPATLEWALALLERQAQHMTRLVDDLLDVSRLGRGIIRLHTEQLDLAQLVRSVVEDQRGPMEAAGLKLELRLPESPVWVMGDGTRLAQVVGNLLNNAAKFSNPGGQVTVEVGVEPEARRALVRVRDNGVGIGPEVLPYLFEIFVQGDRTLTRSRGGLGLGLALVKRLVELHRGEVHAASAGPGQGAEFSFRLPLVEGAVPTGDGPPKPRSGGEPHRILIIDDNADLVDSMRMLLEAYNHTVAVASTGPTGVETAQRFQPKVVLCDLGLPGMDGYAVAGALRADPNTSSAYLIALSGYGSDADQQRTREAGFHRHLVKPVDPEELQRILADLRPAK